MSTREAALGGLGVQVGMQAGAGALAGSNDIPSLSGFGEFTPITVRSYTRSRIDDADVERDKSRD